MGVAEAHQVHHALHRAVLAGRAVKRVEHHVGADLAEPRGDVAVHVDPGDLVAAALQRVGDAVAGDQRDLPLGRPAAHQHRDVEQLHAATSVTPRSWVHALPIQPSLMTRMLTRHSNSLNFPFQLNADCACTRRLTSSPSSSISAELAPPRLSRKLQCFSETWASPIAKPAAAGRVDQLPGLGPWRVLEGRAAGAAAQGLARLALGGDPVHLRLDRRRVACACPRNVAATTMPPSGSSLCR